MAELIASLSKSVPSERQNVYNAEAKKTVISTLFIAAMLATISRLAIRFRYQNRLFADDFVLLLGCSALIAAFTLTNVMFEDVHFNMSLILGPGEVVMQESASVDFVNGILRYQQLPISTETMCWVTIFAVKISYLLFFRHLLDRLRSHLTYWRLTLGIVIISGIFCVCGFIIACPLFGVSSVQCAQGQGFTRTIIISQLENALNLLTDLLIVAVPISLLWKVNIRLNQKIILGTFLCLSVCMFVICLVRAARQTVKSNTGTTLDIQSNIFWLIIEASVAVTVVSLTAFRSLYGIKTLKAEQKDKKRHEPWISSYRKNMFNRRKQRRVDEFGDPISNEHYPLPSIPGATLTGIRTMISGITARSTDVQSKHDDSLSADEARKEGERGLISVFSDLDMHQSLRSYV